MEFIKLYRIRFFVISAFKCLKQIKKKELKN